MLSGVSDAIRESGARATSVQFWAEFLVICRRPRGIVISTLLSLRQNKNVHTHTHSPPVQHNSKTVIKRTTKQPQQRQQYIFIYIYTRRIINRIMINCLNRYRRKKGKKNCQFCIDTYSIFFYICFTLVTTQNKVWAFENIMRTANSAMYTMFFSKRYGFYLFDRKNNYN